MTPLVGKATARAHPNIALAKYWGKAPGAANAPAVPSLSVTLSGMTTTTTVTFDPALGHDVFVLNGSAASGRPVERVTALLDAVRTKARCTTRAAVVSRNDFPTSAGLASSASGFAALALAATAAAGLPIDPSAVSDLARRTSASSARSIFGGYVSLAAGRPGDTGLLAAAAVAPLDHLDLVVLVAVVTEAEKAVASTEGMAHTSRTSPYYEAWLQHAPVLFARACNALLARDMPALGEAAEASALAMHASAMAAQPGVIYFAPATLEALATVRGLRAAGIGAWATMDAGPHVKALCASADAARVQRALVETPGVLRVIETRPGPGAHLVEATP